MLLCFRFFSVKVDLLVELHVLPGQHNEDELAGMVLGANE
jgi:hypothetical protein